MEDLFDKNLHFPDDLLLEILFKLPAKSLFRFKTVSKKFQSLISDPSFFSYYISKNPPPFAFIFQCNNNREIHFFVPNHQNYFKNINFQLPFDQISCEATSNDLILYKTNCPNSSYFIINPFTKNYVTLPIHSTIKGHGPTGFISRVRNGIASYKVVRITECEGNNGNLEIFSSEKGKWESFNLENCTLDFDTRPCVASNGILHWICDKFTTLFAYDPFDDFGKSRFISIPNEAYYMNGSNAILGVSRGRICYFEMSRISIYACKFPGWKLWVLEDYEKGEWSLYQEGQERNIESLGVLSSVLSAHSPLLPVAFHPWDRDLVFFWYEGYVLIFNVKKGWFEDEFFLLSSESMISTCTFFTLLLPFCPTQIPEPILLK